MERVRELGKSGVAVGGDCVGGGKTGGASFLASPVPEVRCEGVLFPDCRWGWGWGFGCGWGFV